VRLINDLLCFLLLRKVIGNVQGLDTLNVQTKIQTISIHELNKAGGGRSNTNERAGRIEHSALVHLAPASISQKMTFATIIATEFQESIYYVMFLAVNSKPDKGHFSIRNNRPKRYVDRSRKQIHIVLLVIGESLELK